MGGEAEIAETSKAAGDMGSEVEKESGTSKPNPQSPKFDMKMKEPQIAALYRDWDAFKKFFQKDKKALMEPFDLSKNTAIHVAARSNNPQLIRELLEMIPEEEDRWRALRLGNVHKNTLLHQVIHCKNVKMVDAVLDYEKQLKVPEDYEEGEDKNLSLLELGNYLGETPVYRAAKYGKLKMLKHMATFVDIRRHFHRRNRKDETKLDSTSILHIAIIGQYFEVALWLTRVKGIDDVALAEDGNGFTCLQLLSRMPSVFKSYDYQIMGYVDRLIYDFLPNKGHDEDEELLIRNGDIERGKENLKPHISSVFSRINYVIWKLIAKESDNIEKIWNRKKKHVLVEKLADFLVEKDISWKFTYHAEPRTDVVLPPVIKHSNVAARKKAKQEKSQSIEQSTPFYVYTPLLLAACTGTVEIVTRIIELHPEAMSHVSCEEQNILHMAVKHRQKKIFKLLKEYGALKRLASQMSNRGRTVLHLVATMDYYGGGNQAGVVFQLQDELRWFERVMKIIPCGYDLHCNDDQLTARELFELEHSDMLKAAQEWIKGTAQSCSAVAVLVATVVFAAAYTVPGGTEDGIPVFLNSPLFLFFTVMDVLALASSLVSVMMFLSILTSPFQMQEFYKSLPRKLTLGFTLLFFSLTTTMLAFGSTILLTIRSENTKLSSTLIYSVTFFPVTLFGLTQFPIVMAVEYRMKRLWKTFKKMVPKGFTKSSKPKRIYSKYS